MENKNKEIMAKIEPLMNLNNITDYEYIVIDNPWFEILRIEDTYINVSANSTIATLNEVLAYLILKSDQNFKGVGSELKRSWMTKESIQALMK